MTNDISGVFLDPEGGSQKDALVVLAVISSLASKNPKGFLNTQQSATKLRTHIRADIAHRSTASYFSLIFSVMSNFFFFWYSAVLTAGQ